MGVGGVCGVQNFTELSYVQVQFNKNKLTCSRYEFISVRDILMPSEMLLGVGFYLVTDVSE